MAARSRIVSSSMVALLVFTALAHGQGVGPEEGARRKVLDLSRRVDELIETKLRSAKVEAAPAAEDGAWFRRLNLDLIGRIPNLLDIDDYLSYDGADKRWFWVERMLQHERFPSHWAAVLRAHMLGENANQQRFFGLQASYENWLENKLKEGTGYDRITREILTGGGYDPRMGFNPGNASPMAFFQVNENKPENLAAATTRVFLGVKLECAQCHAHPFAKWSRDQFWEFAAFFNGTGPMFRVAGVQPPMPQKKGEIEIPGTKKVVKAKYLDGDAAKIEDSTDPRKTLSDWVTAKENPFFAKATVDFVWSYFFGVSLLEPILESSEDSPITHPELLDLLAKEFVASDYDMKHLIRIILHTRAYQRTSGGAEAAHKEDYHLFARMPVRGLTGEQVFDSVAEATDYREASVGNPYNRPIQFIQPNSPRGQFLLKFVSQDRKHETQTSILQALFMMNGSFLEDRLKSENNRSLDTLVRQKTDNERKVRSLFMMVLSRQPRAEEIERFMGYVDRGGPHRDTGRALGDVYWVLLNSGEFLLNH